MLLEKYRIFFFFLHETSTSIKPSNVLNSFEKETKNFLRKFLDDNIDKNLNFNFHIEKICKLVNNKTNALIRIEQARKIAQAYILSQFNYCNLIWMFCSKSANHSIQRAHKRALRVTHQDFSATYPELLLQNGYFNIHQNNLFSLMCEVFKSLNNLNPIFMRDFFEFKQTPCLQKRSSIETPTAKGKTYGIYCLQFRASFSWNNLPEKVKSSTTLSIFKKHLKEHQSYIKISCNCRLCRVE